MSAVLVYVVLDGFDLGVGMLMPAATEEEQSVMVSSIGPFWDGNEVWLLTAGGAIFAALNTMYAAVAARSWRTSRLMNQGRFFPFSDSSL